MPSMYAHKDYDLAGFAVGAVHKKDILPLKAEEGDVVMGLSSTGVHISFFK